MSNLHGRKMDIPVRRNTSEKFKRFERYEPLNTVTKEVFAHLNFKFLRKSLLSI